MTMPSPKRTLDADAMLAWLDKRIESHRKRLAKKNESSPSPARLYARGQMGALRAVRDRIIKEVK